MTSVSRSEHVADLVRKSCPSHDRPRMRAEVEDQFHAIDCESAAAYAAIDDVISGLDEVINFFVAPPDGSNGVVHDEYVDEDSLVQHIEDLRQTTQR